MRGIFSALIARGRNRRSRRRAGGELAIQANVGRSVAVRQRRGPTPEQLEDRMLLSGNLSIVTSPDVSSAGHGDTVNYNYDVTFTPSTPAGSPTAASGDLIVSDDTCSPVTPATDVVGFNIGDTDQDGTLDSTETWRYRCAFTVPAHNDSEADSIVSTATVTGSDTNGLPAGSSPSPSVSVDIVHDAGTLTIAKSANLISVAHGGSVIYLLAVTYAPGADGSPAQDIVVIDANCDAAPAFVGGDANPNGLLDAGEIWSYTCAHAVPLLHSNNEGLLLVNTATVTGHDRDGDAVTGDMSDAVTVEIEHDAGSLNVVKSANATSIAHGVTLTYSFLVTHLPGPDGSPVQNVLVSDPQCTTAQSFQGGDANLNGLLDSSETWNFACNFAVPAQHIAGEEDPIENTATASARDLDGDIVTPATSNTVTVNVTHAAGTLTITKAADRSTVPHAGSVAYTLRVTYAPGSDGSPAANIAVTDAQCDQPPAFTGGDANINGLLDGTETWIYSCTFAVPAAHATGEEDPITNTAAVTGQDLDGDAVTGDTSDVVSIDLVHGTISGRKFLDLDGNATRDANEATLSGFTINLFRDSNGNGSFDDGTDSLVATKVTDAAGTYSFSDLVPGTYFVREVVPARFTQTTPPRVVMIAAIEIVTGQDIGNQPLGAAFIPDPCDATLTALVVVGTAGADQIQITLGRTPGSVTVHRNRELVGTFLPTGHILAYGLGGDDRVTISSSVTSSAIVRGGQGNDNLKGGGGADALIGDEGSDVLNGGGGRDVLIGGTGADRLSGGADDDILVAGSTDLDARDDAICAILDEWTSARVYGLRVRNILDGTGSQDRLNGAFRLNVGTADDDAIQDASAGNSGKDWFLARPLTPTRDLLLDRARSEFVVEI